jgi:pyruvate-ferredoxin/flavodoxin oxidoreductase
MQQKLLKKLVLGNRTNTIMQAAFFKISNVIPYEKAEDQMKKAIVKSFGRKGEEVVAMNKAAVDHGGELTEIEIPAEWKNIVIKSRKRQDIPDLFKMLLIQLMLKKEMIYLLVLFRKRRWYIPCRNN